MTDDFEDNLLSDDALAKLDDELFGRSHLVERVIDVLGRIRTQSKSSTIGVVGAWGSGKSSVLTNVVSRVRIPDATTKKALHNEGWRVAEFNPWLYSDPRALHAGFFTMLRDLFPADDQWDPFRSKLIKFGRFVAPAVGVVTAFLGTDGAASTNQLVDQFDRSAVEQQRAIAEELERLQQPILIVVDDLDRLTATELLEVFKLVRLVGRLPYVYYILSYDEHTLIDLLAKTDLVSADDDRRALDYLEKIIQVRLDMPLLRPFEIDRIVDRTLASLAHKHGVPFEDETSQALSRLFDDVLSTRLRTPRSLKRLFGQIAAFLPSVGGEVDYSDYVVVTWLRTMEPGVYELLQRRRSALLGIESDPVRTLEAPASDSRAIRKDWLAALKTAHVAESDREDVLWVLSTIFPSLGDAYRLGRPAQGNTQSQSRIGRISDADYFDRFFSFGLPADDLSDALTRQALSDITAGNATGSDNAKRLVKAFRDDPYLAIRKLTQNYVPQRSSSPALVQWAEERWRLADDSQVRGRIENVSAEFVRDLTSEQIGYLVAALAASDSGLLFATHLRGTLGRAAGGARSDRESYASAGALMAKTLNIALADRFTALSAEHPSPLELPEVMRSIAMQWFHIDIPGMRALLAQVIPDRWQWLDVMSWLAPAALGDDGQTQIIGPAQSPNIYYQLLDLDQAAVDLEDELAGAPAFEDLVEQEATAEARRDYALAALRSASELSAEAAGESL